MHVVCTSARVWSLPGGLLPSQKEADYSFSGFIPTTKQTNKQLPFGCLCYAHGLCLCPCVITPRGFTSLPLGGGVWVFGVDSNKQTIKQTNTRLQTQQAEYSVSGFIPTHKQTNKDNPYYRLGPVHTCLYVRARETGDWDIFLGSLEWARAETGGAHQWVLFRRGFSGVTRVYLPPCLWDTHYQFSIKSSTLKQKKRRDCYF